MEPQAGVPGPNSPLTTSGREPKTGRCTRYPRRDHTSGTEARGTLGPRNPVMPSRFAGRLATRGCQKRPHAAIPPARPIALS